MKGHVRKRGSKWSFIIDLGRDEVTGKRNQKWFSGYKTKKEAEKAMTEKLNEVNNGTYIEPSNILFSEYMNEWLKDKRNQVRLTTYETYNWLTNNHIIPNLGKYKLMDIKPIHIQKLYTSLKNTLSDEVILKIHTMIKDALTRAEKWNMINKNPAALVDSPTFSKKEIVVWNEEEIRRFLDVARYDRLYIAFLLAITTGMRKGEILGLRWKDIDFNKSYLSIRKTYTKHNQFQEPKTKSSQRSVALPHETLEALKQQKKEIAKEKLILGPIYGDFDLVISTATGNPVSHRNLSRTWYRLLDEADVKPIRFHDLRHTHATLMLKQGVHPKIVQERLGHSNIRITLDTYSHVLPGLQEQAAQQFGENLFGNKSGFKNKNTL